MNVCVGCGPILTAQRARLELHPGSGCRTGHVVGETTLRQMKRLKAQTKELKGLWLKKLFCHRGKSHAPFPLNTETRSQEVTAPDKTELVCVVTSGMPSLPGVEGEKVAFGLIANTRQCHAQFACGVAPVLRLQDLGTQPDV